MAHKHIHSLRRLKQSNLEFKASFPFKTRDRTQGFDHVGQVLDHWATPPAHGYLISISDLKLEISKIRSLTALHHPPPSLLCFYHLLHHSSGIPNFHWLGQNFGVIHTSITERQDSAPVFLFFCFCSFLIKPLIDSQPQLDVWLLRGIKGFCLPHASLRKVRCTDRLTRERRGKSVNR